jgi:hypothetical protein
LAHFGVHFTGQSFQDATHSSLADARMTALAYKRILKFQNEGFQTFFCPDFNDFRADMKQKKKSWGFKETMGKMYMFSS